jgi:hypothetical protein
MHPPWHLGRLGPECACIGKLCLNTVEGCWDWEARFFWRYTFTQISSITVEVGWVHGYFHTGVELGACFRLQAEHFILYFLVVSASLHHDIWDDMVLFVNFMAQILVCAYCQREQLLTNWVHAMWRLPLQFQRSLHPLSPIHMRYREFQSALLENDLVYGDCNYCCNSPRVIVLGYLWAIWTVLLDVF